MEKERRNICCVCLGEIRDHFVSDQRLRGWTGGAAGIADRVEDDLSCLFYGLHFSEAVRPIDLLQGEDRLHRSRGRLGNRFYHKKFPQLLVGYGVFEASRIRGRLRLRKDRLTVAAGRSRRLAVLRHE